jgi:hypothetical protein
VWVIICRVITHMPYISSDDSCSPISATAGGGGMAAAAAAQARGGTVVDVMHDDRAVAAPSSPAARRLMLGGGAMRSRAFLPRAASLLLVPASAVAGAHSAVSDAAAGEAMRAVARAAWPGTLQAGARMQLACRPCKRCCTMGRMGWRCW